MAVLYEIVIYYFLSDDLSKAIKVELQTPKIPRQVKMPDGSIKSLTTPAFFAGGKLVYFLHKDYPSSFMLDFDEEFENLIRGLPMRSLDAELNDYVSLSLFKKRVEVKDIFVIILLMVISALITYVATAHAYASFGIVIPALLKRRPRKIKTRKYRREIKMYNYHVSPKKETYEQHELDNADKILALSYVKQPFMGGKRIQLYSVALHNKFVREKLEHAFYYGQFAKTDRKKIAKEIAEILKNLGKEENLMEGVME